MGGACQQHMEMYFTDHYKNGERSLLVRPMQTPAPWTFLKGRGDEGFVSWGWFTPGELGSRVDLCQDPDPPPFWNTGASVSQSPSRQWAWQSLATPIFWAIFSGGFFGLYIKFVYFFESCWWLWFSLGSLWQQIDKRRGRAHPQVQLVGVATKWSEPRPLPQWQQSAGRSLETVSDHHS